MLVGGSRMHQCIRDPMSVYESFLRSLAMASSELDVPLGKGFARVGAVSWSRGPSRLDGPTVLSCTLRAS